MAGRARLLQTNFAGGEVSRAARGRPDTEIYSSAAEKLRGFVVRANGALDRRPGGVHLGSAVTSSGGHRWFELRRAINHVVRIEAGGGKFRFWDGISRTLIMSGGSPVELDCPWSDDDLRDVRTWQSGDVLFMSHTAHMDRVKALKRLTSNSFVLDDVTFEDGPFLERAKGAPRLNFSGVSGIVTVTATSDVFEAGHVGALIRCEGETFTAVSGWSFDQKVKVGEYCRNGNRIYRASATADPHKTGNAAPVHESGAAWDGNHDDNVLWEFEGFTYGLLEIIAYDASTSVQAKVLKRLPFYSSPASSRSDAQATDIWNISALSDVEGWPACGVIYQDRFCVFGSRNDPDRSFLSRTNRWTPDVADMRPPYLTEVLDDDAISRSFTEEQTAHILWARVMDGLLLGTTLGVRQLSGPSEAEPLTPGGASPLTVSEIPCSINLEPVKAGNALIYPTLGDDGLIELSRARDAVPRDLMEMAEHMSAGGIKSLVWQGWPYRVLWLIDGRDRLVSFTYSPENGCYAFARHVLGGRNVRVIALSSAPGPDGRDEVWLTVQREINGAQVAHVEYLARPFDADEMRVEAACCLDAAASWDLWQVDTVTASDDGNGGVNLLAQGVSPFTAQDVGREFWLTQNGALPDEDDVPGPVRVVVESQFGTGAHCSFVGSYNEAHWKGLTLRIARPTKQLSGLGWLEGESVYVNADGAPFGPFVVQNSKIDLPDWSAKGWVGLAYRSFMRSMPVNGAEGLGTSRTAMGRVSQMGVLPNGIAAGVARRADQHEDFEVQLNQRSADDVLGAAPDAELDDFLISLDMGFDRQKQIEVIGDGPLPLSLSGFLLKVESYG